MKAGFPVDVFDLNFSKVDSAVKSTQKSGLSQFHHQKERSVKYQLNLNFLSFLIIAHETTLNVDASS